MADVLGQERSQLVITFDTTSGDSYNFTLSNPREDIGEAEAIAIAQCILDNQIFLPKIGSQLKSMVKAKVITSETDRFDLTV